MSGIWVTITPCYVVVCTRTLDEKAYVKGDIDETQSHLIGKRSWMYKDIDINLTSNMCCGTFHITYQ